MEATEILNKSLFFVKNVQGKTLVPTLSALDLFDGVTNEPVLQCREPEGAKKVKMYGGDVDLRAATPGGTQVFRIHRQSTAFKIGNLKVYDHGDALIGELKLKALSISKTYRVVDGNGEAAHVIGVKGSLNQYSITLDQKPAAKISLHWKGVNREFFKRQKCIAAIEIAPEAPPEPALRELILAAALSAEMLMS